MTPVVRLAAGNPVVDGWTRDSLRDESEWRLALGPLAAGEAAAHLDRNSNRPSPMVHELEFPALARLASSTRAELATGNGVAWIRPEFGDELDDLTWRGLFSLLCSLLGMAHRRIDSPMDCPDDRSMSTVVVDGLVPDVVGSVFLDDVAATHDVALVSSTGLHSELEQHDPRFLRALYRSVLHMTHRSHDGADHESARYVRAPVFRYEKAARSLEFRYDRARIELAHEISGRPLHRSVVDAFDVLDKSMNLPHLVATLRPRRGDMILVHNRRVVSTRLVGFAESRSAREARALRVISASSREALSLPA